MAISVKVKGIDKTFERLSAQRKELLKVESRKVAVTLFNELKEKTPIDTGFARASWSMRDTSDGFNLENSAPYIERLNMGSSKQAPAHFVESTALKYGKPVGTIVIIKQTE